MQSLLFRCGLVGIFISVVYLATFMKIFRHEIRFFVDSISKHKRRLLVYIVAYFHLFFTIL